MFEYSQLVKRSRPGFDCSTFGVKAYPPDRRLRPYFIVKEYLKKTKLVRKQEDSVFITCNYAKPHKAVTKDTIARWIKTAMCRAGTCIGVIHAPSVRAAATSKASESSVQISDLLRTAG